MLRELLTLNVLFGETRSGAVPLCSRRRLLRDDLVGRRPAPVLVVGDVGAMKDSGSWLYVNSGNSPTCAGGTVIRFMPRASRSTSPDSTRRCRDLRRRL